MIILLDAKAGPHEDLSKIRLFYRAQFMIFCYKNFTCFRTNSTSYSNLKTVILKRVLSLYNGVCKIFKEICHF